MWGLVFLFLFSITAGRYHSGEEVLREKFDPLKISDEVTKNKTEHLKRSDEVLRYETKPLKETNEVMKNKTEPLKGRGEVSKYQTEPLNGSGEIMKNQTEPLLIGRILYFCHYEAISWEGAMITCNRQGMWLAMPRSLDYLTTIMKHCAFKESEDPNTLEWSRSKPNQYWVGAEKQGDDFMFLDGSFLPEDIWLPGEPNHARYNSCLAACHKLDASDCDSKKFFVCERDLL